MNRLGDEVIADLQRGVKLSQACLQRQMNPSWFKKWTKRTGRSLPGRRRRERVVHHQIAVPADGVVSLQLSAGVVAELFRLLVEGRGGHRG